MDFTRTFSMFAFLCLVWRVELIISEKVKEVFDRDDILQTLKEEIRRELKEELKEGITRDLRLEITTALRDEIRQEIQNEIRSELKAKAKEVKEIRHILKEKMPIKADCKNNAVNVDKFTQTTASKTIIERRRSSQNRRLLQTTDSQQHVAFYAQLTQDVPEVGHQQTIIFDSVTTNFGNGYNAVNGMFTAPVAGTYVFSWTTQNYDYTHMQSELVANSIVKANLWSDAGGHHDVAVAANTVVIELESGDVVWIRANKSEELYVMTLQGALRSSFSGWLLFEK